METNTYVGCPFCGEPRKATNEHLPTTCGRSDCQRADFLANKERNRKSSRPTRTTMRSPVR